MSEWLEVEANVGEVESAPEASVVAMGAVACVSCVGCPFMQRCILPQAAEARAREAESQLDEPTEPMAEALAGIDYAAALLDEDGPAVVWAQVTVSSDPEPAPSEEVSSVNERSWRNEAEVVAPASPSWDLSKLWDMSVSEPEPLVESKAVLVSGLEANPDPISESEPEERADTTSREAYQEVCATADLVETYVAPVTEVREVCIEPKVDLLAEPMVEAAAEPVPQVVKPRLAMNETAEWAMIYDEAVVTDEAVDYAGEVELPVVQEVVQELLNTPEIDAERVAATPVHSLYNPPTEIDTPPVVNIIHHEDVAPEVVVPDTEVISVSDIAPLVETVSPPDMVASADTVSLVVAESSMQPVPVFLTDTPVHKECVPTVMDEERRANDEGQLDTGGKSLLVANDKEVIDNEVLLSSVDTVTEGADGQAIRESCQAVSANVVYNTTKRDDDIAPTEHDSDHVESEAPNAGYGTSWLAAILGVVAVFMVVGRRSSAVY